MKPIQRVLTLIAMSLALGACVNVQDVAQTRAANDFRCAEDKVNVWSIGGTSFRADGCGKTAVYNCTASDGYQGSVTDYTCVPETPPQIKAARRRPPVAPDPAVPPAPPADAQERSAR